MKRPVLFFLFLLAFICHGIAQEHSHQGSLAFHYPDIANYKTLKADLHIHTVFSDGKVWPNIRVMEALRENLDAISLTEHLEYQPHKKDIPHPDRNRSYGIALKEAKEHDLMIIHAPKLRETPLWGTTTPYL